MTFEEEVNGYKFREFSEEAYPHLYREYCRIKYEVFVDELGIVFFPHSRQERIAYEDPYDKYGQFVLAQKENESIGISRGLNIQGEFPYQQLFLSHLKVKQIIDLREHLSTINAVAVIPSFRGVKVEFPGLDSKITIGQIIMVLLVKSLKGSGAKIVLLTSDTKRGKSFFKKLGFYIIDKPFYYKYSPHLLINLALIINDKDKFLRIDSPMIVNCRQSILTPEEEDAKAYFETLERQVEQSLSNQSSDTGNNPPNPSTR